MKQETDMYAGGLFGINVINHGFGCHFYTKGF